MVANALGSGLLASGALMGFLPGICRMLLGEELAMPSVATWWCGEKPALDYVREHFDDLVIKPAYPSQRMDPVFGYELKGAARAEMLLRIAARPHAYVAQELVELSQAPGWSRSHERRLLARPVGLRAYAVTTPAGYSVMPGGLARVATGANARIISMQRGGVIQGRLGADRRAGQRIHDAQAVARRSRSGARRRQPDLARRREPVLARAAIPSASTTARACCASRSAALVEAGGQKTPAVESAMELAVHLGILPGLRTKTAKSGRAASTRCSRRSTILTSPAVWRAISAA